MPRADSHVRMQGVRVTDPEYRVVLLFSTAYLAYRDAIELLDLAEGPGSQ